MRKIYAVILLLFILADSEAQEILTQPVPRLLTSFPFKQFSGGVMVIQARFANVPDTLNFILDTGSGGISLDSATCAELNIPLIPTDTTITGIGGIRKVSFAFDQWLNLPGLKVEHLNFHVNDYEVLSSVYGEKIDGIIGYTLQLLAFSDQQVEYFIALTLSLRKCAQSGHPNFLGRIAY